MNNFLVDWSLSVWPLNQPYKVSSKAIGNFQHKLCQKVLPTKKLVHSLVAHYEEHGWPKSIPEFVKKRMKLKYSDDICYFCNQVAGTEHCFSTCPLNQTFFADLTSEIIFLFNCHSHSGITSFKWWFSTHQRLDNFGPDIPGWQLTIGDLGCMPAALGPWLRQHGFFGVPALLLALDKMLQTHVHKLWNFHASTWEAQYQSELGVLQQLHVNQQPLITSFFQHA